MDDKPHALYRFYDAGGQLLYVGITFDPGQRWRAHSKGKPWWSDVARIDVETFPDRQSVLEAERAAIVTERPLHNVVHNSPAVLASGLTTSTPQLDRLLPFQVGDWVALGLRDGRCPVGCIVAADETWVSLRLKSYLHGCLTDHITVVRWTDVAEAEAALPEDATREHGVTEMHDEHLGEFQSAWQAVHFGDDGKHPLAAARTSYRQQQYQMGRP